MERSILYFKLSSAKYCSSLQSLLVILITMLVDQLTQRDAGHQGIILNMIASRFREPFEIGYADSTIVTKNLYLSSFRLIILTPEPSMMTCAPGPDHVIGF